MCDVVDPLDPVWDRAGWLILVLAFCVLCGWGVGPCVGPILEHDGRPQAEGGNAGGSAVRSRSEVPMPRQLHYQIAFEREDDGRFIAEIPRLAGVLPVYGQTRAEARRRIVAAALFHLSNEMDAGSVDLSSVQFRAA